MSRSDEIEAVIPGRREAANPETRGSHFEIPGSPLRIAPE
jgi:hypothetical protein